MMNARRLAALDMWGSVGSLRRRSIIRAEFFVGVVGCLGLGIACVAGGQGLIVWLGVWLVGAGANYIPLAVHAGLLMRTGALEAELADVDVPRELRRAGVQQLWIAVPFAVALGELWRLLALSCCS
jgi:hypothetical protein